MKIILASSPSGAAAVHLSPHLKAPTRAALNVRRSLQCKRSHMDTDHVNLQELWGGERIASHSCLSTVTAFIPRTHASKAVARQSLSTVSVKGG